MRRRPCGLAIDQKFQRKIRRNDRRKSRDIFGVVLLLGAKSWQAELPRDLAADSLDLGSRNDATADFPADEGNCENYTILASGSIREDLFDESWL